MSNTAPADSGTTLAGKLPDRNGFYGNKYSCNFGFQQRYEEGESFPGIADPFYQATLTEDDYPKYIVAGSNEIEPIQVNIPTDSFSGNIPDGFDFEEKSDATANPNRGNVFQHFPTGGGTFGVEARNPLDVCIEENLCPGS